MPVSPPVAGPDMDFYIPLFQSLAGGDDRIQPVSPLAPVEPSGVDYLDGLTLFGDQVVPVQQVLPDFNDSSLRESVDSTCLFSCPALSAILLAEHGKDNTRKRVICQGFFWGGEAS